jgi:hypothetical protein
MSTTPEKYSLTFKINGETKKKRTDDISKALDDVRPPLVLTEMYVTVKKGKHLIERKLNLIQARKLFADSTAREIFINNLMLERYG